MIKARKLVAGALAGASALVGVATLATSPSASAAASLPTNDYVKVSNSNGVLQVSTAIPGQPLLGATVDTNTGRICVGFSKQVPACAALPVTSTAAADLSGIVPIVTVDADPSDGTVGAYTRVGDQPLLGVRYNALSGVLCAGFSYQVPICVEVGPIAIALP